MSKCWSCGAKVERQPNYCHGCHHVVCLACSEKYDHIGYGGKHGRRPTKRAPDAPKRGAKVVKSKSKVISGHARRYRKPLGFFLANRKVVKNGSQANCEILR